MGLLKTVRLDIRTIREYSGSSTYTMECREGGVLQLLLHARCIQIITITEIGSEN